MSDQQKKQFPRAGEGSYFDHGYNRYLKMKAGSGNIGFLVEKGMPRFKLYSNDPAEKDKGGITVKMNPHHLRILNEMIHAVADKKIPHGIVLDLTDHDFFGGVRSEAPSIQCKIIVRRNENSCVEMVVHAKKRQSLTLDFAQKFDWHDLSSVEGGDVPPHIKSEFNAKAVADDWLSLLDQSQIFSHRPEHHEKKNSPSRGNNNRNFNNNSGDFKSRNNQQSERQVTNDSWSSSEVDMESFDDVNF